MKKIIIVSMAALLLVAGTINAYATNAITYNDGTGAIQFATFDWSPDNVLAVGAIPLAAAPGSTSFTVLGQTSLGNFLPLGSNTPILGTNLNSTYEITSVFSFPEIGNQTTSTLGGITSSNANFAFDSANSNPTNNFFQIWLSAINSNALAGTGYNDGILLMSGQITSGFGTFAVPNINAAPVALDQFGTNNYPDVLTVTGSGGTSINTSVLVSSINTTYFPDAPSYLTLDLFLNTSNILPFNEQDPAAQMFDGTAPTFGFFAGQSVNGIAGADGPVDILFQADPNASVSTTAVPEPSTMLLSGLGLLALAGRMLRRRSQE